MIDKTLASKYSNVIAICRLLKPHATNIMLMEDGKILMQPVIPGIRNYMVCNTDIDYTPFIHTYFSLPMISGINTKFKKTKSDIDWNVKDGTKYLVIENPDMEPYETPIMSNDRGRQNLITATYNKVPGWEDIGEDILCSEPDSEYIELPNEIIERMLKMS